MNTFLFHRLIPLLLLSGLQFGLYAQTGQGSAVSSVIENKTVPVAKYMAIPATSHDARWQDYKPEQLAALDALILRQDGTVPLILEIPHDGLVALPTVTKRLIKSGARDTNCQVVAQRIVDTMVAQGSGRPWLLSMQAARDWIDVNQDPGATAYGDEFTRDLYDRYYWHLYQMSRQIMESNHRGFQFSIHCGGNLGSADVYFGTNGGASIRAFSARAGKTAFDSPQGLPALVAAQGLRVPGQNGRPAHRGWTGGVAARYTYRDPLGIDSTQIEIERILFMHDQTRRNQLADKLASALGTFISLWY